MGIKEMGCAGVNQEISGKMYVFVQSIDFLLESTHQSNRLKFA